MAALYDRGDKVRVTGRFTDLGGALADPTAATYRVRSPTGSVTTGTATKQATGVWYFEFTLTASGTWSYRLESTGDVTAAAESHLQARPSLF